MKKVNNTLNTFYIKMIDFLKKLFKSEKFQSMINIAFSLCFVIGFNYYFFRKSVFGKQTFFNFVLLFFAYFLLNKNKKVPFKDKRIAYIFSTIFSLSIVIGKVIYDNNNIIPLYSRTSSIFLNFITFIGFLVVLGEIVYLIFNKLLKMEKDSSKMWSIFNTKCIYFILFIIIFASWIPAFLAYYPGICSYDITTQTSQIFTGVYTKHHPPIHTFLIKLCFMIGNNISINPIAIYSILQMIFLAAVLAKMIKMLINKKVNNWIILLGLLFVTINPIISIFSMITTKDVCFTGFLILFILEIIKLLENPEKYFKSPFNWLKYILFVILTCLFRNNAVYAIILSTPLFMIVLKRYWKEVLIMTILALCGFYFIFNNVYDALNIKDVTPKEMLSVPIQQISRVIAYHDNELSDKTKKEINKFLPYNDISKKYNPRFADPTKSLFNNDYYDENKTEFFKLWLKLFKKYPSEYVSAFLALNIPYWYIDANSIDTYSKRAYIEDGMYKNKYFVPVRESKIPQLYEFYSKIASFKAIENIPLVSNICALSTPIWLILFTMFFLIYKKQIKTIIIILPIMFLWLTYIAGPVSNFRYVFPLICLYPLLIALLINSNKFNYKQ